MYEVQNRSVGEHELFSFEVERHNLRWLYNANTDFVQEMRRVDALDQVADHSRLGKNQVFKKRVLTPRRLKGVSALASAFGLYSYAPYLAIYIGTTMPVLGAVVAGLYGMFSFSESQIVNSITLIKDGGEHHGQLTITVGLSAFTSEEIIVDVKDIHSVCALGDDDLGDEGVDGNVLRITRHYSKAAGKWIEVERPLTLPGDSFRDRSFLDWILADKTKEGDLADSFQDLMMRKHELSTKKGKIGQFDVLAGRDNVTLLGDSDAVIDAQIRSEDPRVDSTLQRLQSIYGADHLKTLPDSDLYKLYKLHVMTGAK